MSNFWLTKSERRGVQELRQNLILWFCGQGIFTTDGAFWQHSRSILRPNFDKSLISALDQFEPYVQKLISRIPKDGSTVDLQVLFHQLSMDTSTDFILEHGTDYLGGDEKAAMIDDNINKCLEHGAWREMLGPLRFLLPNGEARKALKAAHAELDVWVKQAMEHKDSADLEDGKAKDTGKRYVFINELARHKEVDAIRIRDEVMNIILAGKDTTASCLSGLWFILAREPEIYKKLQAEVAQLNGERPSYESLRNMKYIKHTVQEGKDIPNPTSLPHASQLPLTLPSPPPLHPRPTLHEARPQRHRPPPRRRHRRPATALRPQRLQTPLQPLLDHAPEIHLRPRRRRFPAGALGRPGSASRVGIPAFRRRVQSLFGPAVCADGDVLCYDQDVAGV
jgi:hypothetical protein